MRRTVLPAAMALVPALCLAAPADAPPLRDLIGGLPFTAEQAEKVAGGGIVVTPVVPVSKGELAIGLACLVKRDNTGLAASPPAGRWLVPQDYIQATGILEESGNAALVSAIQRMLEDGEGTRYVQAKPGLELNLSGGELERLAAAGDGTHRSHSDLVPEFLIERFRGYRSGGLSAVASYARGRGVNSEPGMDLRQSTLESLGVQAYFPSMHDALLHYPGDFLQVRDEGFHWVTARLGQRDAVLLTHTLSMRSDAAGIVVTRAYYVSHSLNALQALTVFAPVVEGTLFLYVYRAWLDRARGFGGTFAAGVARDIMTREMQELARLTGACD